MPLNIQSSRSARGDPISPGRLCGQRNYKEGCFIAPDNSKQWSLERSGKQKSSFIVYICSWIHPWRNGKANFSAICLFWTINVGSQCKKTCPILLIIPLKSTKTPGRQYSDSKLGAQSQLFTEWSLMFSFTPPLSASIQQPLLLKRGCFHYMEIIPFPQSSLERLRVCLVGASGYKLALVLLLPRPTMVSSIKRNSSERWCPLCF